MHANFLRVLGALLVALIAAGGALAQADDEATIEQFYRKGAYVAAGGMAERLAAARLAQGEDTPEYAAAIGWLALTDYMQGSFNEAEMRASQSLRVRAKLPPSDPRLTQHPPLAELVYVLADIFARQNRLDDAAVYYRRALDAHHATGGLSPLFLKIALFRLGEIKQGQQQLGEAAELY